MKRPVIFLILIFSIFYLSSCGSIPIKPESFIESVDYKVIDGLDGEKTVQVVALEKNKYTHWVYLNCDYIFGCYMRCEGPVNSCMKIATLGKLDMKYIMTKKKDTFSQPNCHQFC